MTASDLFDRHFAACPLVAVLRGLTPAEAPAIGAALVEAGISLIEVPLNSPDPLDSIAALSQQLGDRALVGAGTVLDPATVGAVRDAGGLLIVSPNTNPAVIAATLDADMVSLPGFFTPSEGFAAVAAGAHALKLFPAEGASPAMLRAHRAVLPRATRVLAVGGITPDSMEAWRAAGADGFGLGTNLYQSGKPADAVAADAARYVAALAEARP